MDSISSNNLEIFDCHLHVQDGLNGYNLPLSGANVIFNTVESYEKYALEYAEFYHTLIFDLTMGLDFYKNLIAEDKISALKIHSRLQQIDDTKYLDLIEALAELEGKVPVIYDAFYYGSDLRHQPSLKGLIRMIKALPQQKFIIAHAGGYQIIKYFFHLREFKNVGYDLSLSLQYLWDSSCKADLIKLIKYTPKHRLFFGRDYHDGDPLTQLMNIEEIAHILELSEEDKQNMISHNWKNFIGKSQK